MRERDEQSDAEAAQHDIEVECGEKIRRDERKRAGANEDSSYKT